MGTGHSRRLRRLRVHETRPPTRKKDRQSCRGRSVELWLKPIQGLGVGRRKRRWFLLLRHRRERRQRRTTLTPSINQLTRALASSVGLSPGVQLLRRELRARGMIHRHDSQSRNAVEGCVRYCCRVRWASRIALVAASISCAAALAACSAGAVASSTTVSAVACCTPFGLVRSASGPIHTRWWSWMVSNRCAATRAGLWSEACLA